jgi:hypothetical protein
MALLKEKSTIELYKRFFEVDYKLRDYFISAAESNKLIQEQENIIKELRNRGYNI